MQPKSTKKGGVIFKNLNNTIILTDTDIHFYKNTRIWLPVDNEHFFTKEIFFHGKNQE